MSVGKVRMLMGNDELLIQRLLRTSEYVYQRFTLDELPRILRRCPAAGMLNDSSLYGFLLVQILNPAVAWIAGFGVSWTESRAYAGILHRLLDFMTAHLARHGFRSLYYSGNDLRNDWLRDLLLRQSFLPYQQLYAYDKFDFGIPTTGNQQVRIRPVRLPAHLAADRQSDLPALLWIEEACFEEVWRYDGIAFSDIAATHPYFVVAELNGQVVGYQFNAVDGEAGYLVRIAVHPSFSGRGIGARLLAEAVHFFAQAHVSRIMLNTQEENVHAHRLYEWFGFFRQQQIGFVLRKPL
ncbi:MAG: GNAT family N-acetyltransferase [Ktedonobacteraceae bacterium]|nr:GNAT family N-acetyltransferase [Ktedonobacteraceae bacterium]